MKKYELVRAEESTDYYIEQDVLVDGEIVGQVTKYTDEDHFKAWNQENELIGEYKTVKGAINKIMKELAK